MFLTPSARPVICPRPGESRTAAIFRALDPRAGSGLSEMDRLAIRIQDGQRQAERIAELERELAETRDGLADAHELLACFEGAEMAGAL